MTTHDQILAYFKADRTPGMSTATLPTNATAIKFKAKDFDRAMRLSKLPISEERIDDADHRVRLHRFQLIISQREGRVRNEAHGVILETSFPLSEPCEDACNEAICFELGTQVCERLFSSKPVHGQTKSSALDRMVIKLVVCRQWDTIYISDSQSDFVAAQYYIRTPFVAPLTTNAATAAKLSGEAKEGLRFMLREVRTFPQQGLKVVSIADDCAMGGNPSNLTLARPPFPVAISANFAPKAADILQSVLSRMAHVTWSVETGAFILGDDSLTCRVETLANSFPDFSIAMAKIAAADWRWSVAREDLEKLLFLLSIVEADGAPDLHFARPDDDDDASIQITVLGRTGGFGRDICQAIQLGQTDDAGADRRISLGLKPISAAISRPDVKRAELCFHSKAMMVKLVSEAGETTHILGALAAPATAPIARADRTE